MTTLKGSGVPFPLRRLARGEWQDRERLLNAFPGTRAGFSPDRWTAFLRAVDVNIRMRDVARSPRLIPGAVIPVALSADQKSDSDRLVLGLGPDTARHLVDLALGRPMTHSTGAVVEPLEPLAPLAPGEEGALLYALDVLGGDWITAGGPAFVIRTILFDQDQVADYLDGPPDWQVTARLTIDEFEADAWLWLKGVPARVGVGRPIRAPVTNANWEAEIRLVVGWSRVRSADLHGLQIGDLVVLDTWHHPLFGTEGRDPLLVSGSWRRFGKWLDKRRIEVIRELERGLTMQTDSGSHDEVKAVLTSDAGGAEGEMEVLVRVEVGDVRMTVAKAESLVPGRILRLNRDVGPEVWLKVGEKVIGRGELVEYEGGMAVEVKETR